VILDDETEYQGVSYYNNNDMNNSIHYTNSMIVVLDSERESLAIHTEYQLSTSLGTIDLKACVEVIEL
jgi:hypothetical protein